MTARADGPLVLAVESSCDETGIALIAGGRRILSNVVASQTALHAASGGIVPEYVSLPRGVTRESGEVAWSRDPR